MGKSGKKSDCCEKYKDKKGKPCKDCPLFLDLSKKERRKLLDKLR